MQFEAVLSRVAAGLVCLILGCMPAPGTQTGRSVPAAEARVVSLLGDTLPPLPLPEETRADYTARLREAETQLAARPNDPDALIWVGRRMAYLGRYGEAIEIFTHGIAQFPQDARFLRHRGHRYITVRQFDLAAADLERAASLIGGRADQVEPDGLPNARNVPTSTLQSNIWYHLGLAYYLMGRFEDAVRAYREAMKVSRNPDMLVATSHWLYMTLRRLNRANEAELVLAPIHRELDVIENQAYHRLLLMYKAVIPIEEPREPSNSSALEDATIGYGIGNFYLYTGRRSDAERVFRRVLAGANWAAFGHIAAEAELVRLANARNTPPT